MKPMSSNSPQATGNPTLGGSLNNELVVQAAGVHKVYHTGQVSVAALRGVDKLCVSQLLEQPVHYSNFHPRLDYLLLAGYWNS